MSNQPKLPALALLVALPLMAGFDVSENSLKQPAPAELASGTSIKIEDVDARFTSFESILSDGYLKLAAQESRDWQSAQHFAKKSSAISDGYAPSPEYLEDWVLDVKTQPVLADARERLIIALRQGGQLATEDGVRVSMAKAQVGFDCWVARAERSWSALKTVQCRRIFEEALLTVNRAVMRLSAAQDDNSDPMLVSML